MARRQIKPEKEIYELLDTWLNDSLTKDPTQARKIFASNIYQRTLSLLMGRYRSQQQPLRCAKDGSLYVIGPEHIPCTMGATRATIAGAGTTGSATNDPIMRYGLWVYDYDVQVEIRQPEFIYDDYFVVKAGTYYEDRGYWQGIRISNDNDDGSHDATIQLVTYRSDNLKEVTHG